MGSAIDDTKSILGACKSFNSGSSALSDLKVSFHNLSCGKKDVKVYCYMPGLLGSTFYAVGTSPSFHI